LESQLFFSDTTNDRNRSSGKHQDFSKGYPGMKNQITENALCRCAQRPLITEYGELFGDEPQGPLSLTAEGR